MLQCRRIVRVRLRCPFESRSCRSLSSGPSSSTGSIHSDPAAAWIASSGEMPCLSALGWSFTQRSGPAPPGSPRTCSCRSWPPRRQARPAPPRSNGPPRPASAQLHDQDAHAPGVSVLRRRTPLRPRRPTSGSAPRSPWTYRITKIAASPEMEPCDLGRQWLHESMRVRRSPCAHRLIFRVSVSSWLRDLLVELHSEQESEGLTFEQLVGGVGRGEVPGHEHHPGAC